MSKCEHGLTSKECYTCASPKYGESAPPQRKPLTVTDLQEALVYTNLIDRDAIDDPENYDDGSTLEQIDALHRLLFKSQEC